MGVSDGNDEPREPSRSSAEKVGGAFGKAVPNAAFRDAAAPAEGNARRFDFERRSRGRRAAVSDAITPVVSSKREKP